MPPDSGPPPAGTRTEMTPRPASQQGFPLTMLPVGEGGLHSSAISASARSVPGSLCPLTLVSQLKPLPVLGVVAVEVDQRLVRGAEQRGRQVGAAELPEERAGGVRPVLDLQEVVVRLRGEVQELDVRACGRAAGMKER